MNILFSFFAAIVLVLLSIAGIVLADMYLLFGVIIPYAAVVIFTVGVIYRVQRWARSPVPFSIPITAGQQKTLPWIKQNRIENPSNTAGVIGRMLLEVLLFRSLFRGLKSELAGDSKVVYGSAKWLWVAGLVFHYSFLIVLLRHIRFFTEPVPFFYPILKGLDGFMEIGMPTLFISTALFTAAATYLFLRRVFIPQVRYISNAADYFPLLLIIGIAVTGILMRHFMPTDLVGIKYMMMGLVTFAPIVVDGIGVIFYVHLFLVSALFAYFPFSKLVHAGGVFFSPTRNLTANGRDFIHTNPWNYPVKVHTYEEYEEEFREKMKMVEIPVEKG